MSCGYHPYDEEESGPFYFSDACQFVCQRWEEEAAKSAERAQQAGVHW